MVWDQLAINKPHLAYLILGGFTSLFMLVSLFVKEKLYIGEATVATLCGVIFGPHAANLFDPGSWGNTDQITLECSRIVLVVQCFAVGVELPKAYMERHWRSVLLLLVPVMTFGWLITSLFIWWLIEPLSWLESLCCAACVTATDPVLASSVVGKGKFAKRVPKHLRDLLSAESGCNDGMAFPFIYLALYLIRYRPDAGEVAKHWISLTIFYECIWGATYGFIVGYLGRHAVKWASRKGIIDRQSFLVFYFVIALFCAGSGSLLGMDDLLVGFAAGVGFSNDGWFQEETEDSHVSDVIDLLLNLAYFVYLGSIIPWQQYNDPSIGTSPWRLAVISILVIFFRRIPIMLILKPIIPDIKNWREALFAGHFGPIGVGAIFVAILARAELESDSTTPLAVLPEAGSENYVIVQLIWPITTFLVISSILVHGSSVAVFTLGKRINTLNITMSYTQANEEGPAWMNRLPRMSGAFSRSQAKSDFSNESNEKLGENAPPGSLGPIGIPGQGLLRRQKEEDDGTRSPINRPPSRRQKWDSHGPGGPVSQSAIAPQRRHTSDDSEVTKKEEGESETPSSTEEITKMKSPVNAYEEGNNIVFEDDEGNVVDQERTGGGEGVEKEIKQELEHPAHRYHTIKKRLGTWNWGKHDGAKSQGKPDSKSERKRGPALAYQYGNTIIIEDEDGEVVKKFDIPGAKKQGAQGSATTPRPRVLSRMGTWLGGEEQQAAAPEQAQAADEDEDRRLRFTAGGRRMSKVDFINQMKLLDPSSRMELLDDSDAPLSMKQELKSEAKEEQQRRSSRPEAGGRRSSKTGEARRGSKADAEGLSKQRTGPEIVEEEEEEEEEPREVPHHSLSDELRKLRNTAAGRRRQAAQEEEDSDDDGTQRRPPPRATAGTSADEGETLAERRRREDALWETPAERRRREGALSKVDDDSDDDDTPRQPPARLGIRFADDPRKK